MQVGFTALKAAQVNIVEFLACVDRVKEQTHAMKLGSAVHSLLETGEYDFGEVLPAGGRRPAGSRAWKENEVAHAKAIVARAEFLGFRVPGEVEPEVFLEGEHFIYRAKPDVVDWDNGIIYDYKTISACPLDKKILKREIANREYYMQLTYYASIIAKAKQWQPKQYCLIFLSTGKAEHAEGFVDCRRVFLSMEWIYRGFEKLKQWFEVLESHRLNDFKENVNDYTIYDLEKPAYV